MAKENNAGKTLSRSDIVKLMAEKSKEGEVSFSQRDCSCALNYLKDAIVQSLATGYKVQLTGLLTLQPSYRSSRKGNNVVTGEVMDIPETIVLSIKAGNCLREAVKAMDKATLKAIKTSAKSKK